MKRDAQRLITLIILATVGTGLLSLPVRAEVSVTDEVNALNDEITAREARQEQLDNKLKQYTDTIRQKEAAADSLENELAIIENKAAKLALDLESTGLDIDNTNDEVQVLDLQINEETHSAERQRAMLASVLREMQRTDDVSTLELIFGHANFSTLFETLSQLEAVHNDLHQLLNETKNTQARLETKKTTKQEKLAQLEDLQNQMEQQRAGLEESQGSKELLLTQTESSELQYKRLIYELRQEQSSIDSELATLQRQIDQKINDSDLLGDSTLLNWPVSGFIITTLFHDPTYPFKNLFPHSGIDLAVKQGSVVHAAAPGYVAFAKTGRMYGNYVMIIHGNGIATLYAHLSRMDVQADQFVGRGDAIGLSGGLPGVQGSGFSTGPHVHFEVRLDGIPVDPMGYVVGD